MKRKIRYDNQPGFKKRGLLTPFKLFDMLKDDRKAITRMYDKVFDLLQNKHSNERQRRLIYLEHILDKLSENSVNKGKFNVAYFKKMYKQFLNNNGQLSLQESGKRCKNIDGKRTGNRLTGEERARRYAMTPEQRKAEKKEKESEYKREWYRNKTESKPVRPYRRRTAAVDTVN